MAVESIVQHTPGPCEQALIDVGEENIDLVIAVGEKMRVAAREQDAIRAELLAALEAFGQHRTAHDDRPGCRRLFKGLAFTNDSDCDCGLYAAIAKARGQQ